MPQITLKDISLCDYGLTERVSYLRSICFRAMPEICIERPRPITRFAFDRDLSHLDGELLRRRLTLKSLPLN